MRKGHVPLENLERYRRLTDVARTLDSLGNQLGGLGEYGDANILWAMSGRWQGKANQLRVDLPDSTGH